MCNEFTISIFLACFSKGLVHEKDVEACINVTVVVCCLWLFQYVDN